MKASLSFCGEEVSRIGDWQSYQIEFSCVADDTDRWDDVYEMTLSFPGGSVGRNFRSGADAWDDIVETAQDLYSYLRAGGIYRIQAEVIMPLSQITVSGRIEE